MKITAFKIAGILGGSIVVSFGVRVFNFLNSLPVDSIRSKLESEFKGTNVIFLGRDHPEWINLRDKYLKTSNKPKSSDGRDLDGIREWCVKNIDSPFGGKEDYTYKQVKSFCFFNINTFLSELKGKDLISGIKNDVQWQDAWDIYNSKKESLDLSIVGATNDATLNGKDKVDGGAALHDWCTLTSKKKMYSDDVDTLFPRFKTWCVT